MSTGPDLAGLLEALDRHRVDHVVTGSVGALAHGASDVVPGDLDIVPSIEATNLTRLASALWGALAAPCQRDASVPAGAASV